MKVQLVVVQGKPEGKSIPLAGPNFKIGRGDGCHLRPNSDLVSREHAEFLVQGEEALVQDLGSRNGTEVNGKKLAANSPVVLKNGDLVKIGTLTFAVAIEGAVAAKAAPASAPRKPTSLDDISGDDIDSWLVSDGSRPAPERPSGVYGGDTMTIDTFNAKSSPQIPVAPKAVAKPTPPPVPAPAPVPVPVAASEPEPEPEDEEVLEESSDEAEEDDGIEDLAAMQEAEAAREAEEEYVDESNPFHVAKKAQSAPAPTAASAKGPSKDSSDAAGDILRKMMDRRRASKS